MSIGNSQRAEIQQEPIARTPEPRRAGQAASEPVVSRQTSSSEEETIDAALLAYCVEQKGGRNAAAFFNAMYGSKSLEQKRAAAESLGLSIPALSSEPKTESQAAFEAQSLDEAEIFDAAPAALTADHSKVADLIEHHREAGATYDQIDTKIAAITGGAYALEDLSVEDAAKVARALGNWNHVTNKLRTDKTRTGKK